MALVKVGKDFGGTFPDGFNMWTDIIDEDDDYYYVDSDSFPDEDGDGYADFYDAWFDVTYPDISMKPSQAGAGG